MLGLLGPNGAGKTTVVRILSTILGPDSGHASVLGHDVVTQPEAVRSIIGLAGQYAAVDENLTGRENIHMVARLSHLSRQVAARRANELLEEFGLANAGRSRAQDLLGRDAAAAGPGRRAGGQSARPLPRRTHDRAGSPEPPGTVGRHRGAGARGHDRPLDDPVPRGSRPAGPRHRGDRPRARHRPGHAGTTQGRPGDIGRLGDAGRAQRRGRGGRTPGTAVGEAADRREPGGRADGQRRSPGRRRRAPRAGRGTDLYRRPGAARAQPRRRVPDPDRSQDDDRRGAKRRRRPHRRDASDGGASAT